MRDHDSQGRANAQAALRSRVDAAIAALALRRDDGAWTDSEIRRLIRVYETGMWRDGPCNRKIIRMTPLQRMGVKSILAAALAGRHIDIDGIRWESDGREFKVTLPS